MSKITEKLLTQIKEGEVVDSAMLVGHIATPTIPNEVFTYVRKANGEIFKKYLEADKWIAWLNSVAEKNVDPEADLTEKAIVGSRFYRICNRSLNEIELKERQNMSGTIWIENGNSYSITLAGKQIDQAKLALLNVQETAVKPLVAEDTTLDASFAQCDTDAIYEIATNHV